ncbi:lipopolysaccharide-induced tumor necrosis factor-alpha factor homolog [Bacillus rossius redtenbacheri]|uniref:lipopolysaccharide-induced tumor necrosis factor-alpha factor homolog n=1 Tax=Bacillus rossius redtenbacheri TaxID=93214 RepID=UPI002FDD36DB
MSQPEYPKPGGDYQPPHQGPPPPYGMYPPPPPPTIVPPQSTVVVVSNASLLGNASTTVQCPSCRATVQTRVQFETSTRTHLMALLLCLVGCWPCAVIPYCTESCQNATHYCPSCGAFLGAYAN